MKHYKWLYGAMALTILGACSDRDFLPEENQNIDTVNQTKADGYIAVQIMLPQEIGTRADGDETTVSPEDTGAINGQYGDGTSDEYHVDNALIAIFVGANENDATFYRAQKLEKPFFTNLPADDGVTSSYIAAIQAQRPANSTDKYFALVILNSNLETTGIKSENGEDVLYLGTQKIDENTPFSSVKNITTSASFISKNEETRKDRFFMTNAPMSKVKGDAKNATPQDITYMTELSSKVYSTPDSAKNNVAGCVYVERAMAKVTCQGFTNMNNIQLTLMDDDIEQYYNPDVTNYEVTDKRGWTISADVTYALTNTANTSFLIRNVDFSEDSHFDWNLANTVNGFTRYRMIGEDPIPELGEPFHATKKYRYRTYWCRDPHYYAGEAFSDKTMITGSDTFSDLDKTLYCKENTFQVVNQNYANTTMAVFRVDYNISSPNGGGQHLYIRDGNHKSVYVTPETAYYDGVIRIINDLNVQNAVKNAVVAGKTLPEGFSMLKHLEIVFKNSGAAGKPKYLEITNIKLLPGEDEDFFDENSSTKFDEAISSTKARLLEKVNALTDVTVFENGVAYYAVPIKHFGDYYTPWDKNIKGTTTNDVYNEGKPNWNNDTHAQKYLGRYGIVRNNWYDLNITKITGLESPVIPDVTVSTSDDNNDDTKYFSVEIHILSWAKRLQNIEL